jgi:cytochrome c oxidase subunit 4
MSAHIVPVKTYVGIFIALLVLTALTIAVIKMLLVILFFMHVKYSSGLTRIVIVAGFFFLAILVSLTLADEFTRGWTPNAGPWSVIVPFLHGLF